jgi:molecular chaperone DnaK
VAFDIDANGIVSVSARDVATGREQRITISGSSGLSSDEVNRMVKDAEAHQAEDRTRRELVDARNQAEALAWSVERALGESRDRLPAGEVSRVESAVAAARTAALGEDLAAIRTAIDGLEKASHAMAEQLYTPPGGGGRGPETPEGGSSDVVDGEVVEA